MPATIATTLIRIARQRNKAYALAGALTGSRAQAISKIQRVAEWYKQKPPAVQTQAVKTLAPEIRLIIPHPQSRFCHIREQMLELLASVDATNPA